MYLPEMFAVTDPAERDFILANLKLGCLVTKDENGFLDHIFRCYLIHQSAS